MAPRERAAAHKSRGERSRLPTVAAAPASLADGRLSEAEWLSLLAAERGDRDVGDILAELVGRVMDGCAKANAARQRVPFTVSWVRGALLEVAQCCFPARDEGETDPEGDGAWREDEEPETCTVDSWARGSVPVLHTCPSPGEGEQVSMAQAPLHWRQDPPTAAEAGGPPTAGPVLPTPAPSHPEPLPDKVAIAPRPPRGKSPHARPPPSRPALLRRARPPAPCPPPGLAKPLEQLARGWRPPWPSQFHGDARGSSVAGVEMRTLLPPCFSNTGLEMIWPARPPSTVGVGREGSDAVPGAPWLHPRSRPQRWIRPQVEVLDVGAAAKPLARPQGAHGHGRGLERGSWRLSRGLVTARGSPQPPSPQSRGLGSPLHRARPGPGAAIGRGGSVRRGPRIPARGEDKETGEAEWEPRPLCARRDPPGPGRLLTRRVRHVPT